jgi:hypothetical protein
MFNEPVDNLNCTVMTQAEPLRKRLDRWTSSLGQSFDCQQDLVLLRFDALRPSSFFA